MKTLTSLFRELSHEPSTSLKERVLLALREEWARSLRQQYRLALLGVVTSGVGFVFMIFFFGATLVHSEFWSLLMLLFSDMQIVIGSSQDFFVSLLETVPVIPITLFLMPLMILLWSASVLVSFLAQQRRERFFFHANS